MRPNRSKFISDSVRLENSLYRSAEERSPDEMLDAQSLSMNTDHTSDISEELDVFGVSVDSFINEYHQRFDYAWIDRLDVQPKANVNETDETDETDEPDETDWADWAGQADDAQTLVSQFFKKTKPKRSPKAYKNTGLQLKIVHTKMPSATPNLALSMVMGGLFKRLQVRRPKISFQFRFKTLTKAAKAAKDEEARTAQTSRLMCSEETLANTSDNNTMHCLHRDVQSTSEAEIPTGHKLRLQAANVFDISFDLAILLGLRYNRTFQ